MHRIHWVRLACLGTMLLGLAGPAAAQVEYRVTFEGLWASEHVESGSLPPGAHFTTLIGATHDATPLWAPGALASTGIEGVAELGATSDLSDEIQDRITAGTAGTEIGAPGLFSFPSAETTTFSADLAHPFVSFASMVAPSPDWFVGVSGANLAPGGVFVDSLSVDLMPYDAGTEDGDDFSLSNPPTVPQQPIAIVNGSPFVGTPVIGRLTFTKITTLPAVGPPHLVALGALLAGCAALLRVRHRGRSGARQNWK